MSASAMILSENLEDPEDDQPIFPVPERPQLDVSAATLAAPIELAGDARTSLLVTLQGNISCFKSDFYLAGETTESAIKGGENVAIPGRYPTIRTIPEFLSAARCEPGSRRRLADRLLREDSGEIRHLTATIAHPDGPLPQTTTFLKGSYDELAELVTSILIIYGNKKLRVSMFGEIDNTQNKMARGKISVTVDTGTTQGRPQTALIKRLCEVVAEDFAFIGLCYSHDENDDNLYLTANWKPALPCFTFKRPEDVSNKTNAENIVRAWCRKNGIYIESPDV